MSNAPDNVAEKTGNADSRPPSDTFLFDAQRTGRMPYSGGTLEQPQLVWRFQAPSYPPKGPESSPVFDARGNVYFGSHDGCYYSLDNNGVLRWMFKTGDKVYSSAAIQGDRIVVCSGDGNCLCFDLNGVLQWAYNTADYFKTAKNRVLAKLSLAQTKAAGKDQVRKKPWVTRCWSSPLITPDGTVYITGYGLGLHALSLDDGSLQWQYDLGSPRNHLSGVALSADGDIFVASQRNHVHCLNSSGTVLWRKDIPPKFDTWGNPTVDTFTGTVYFPISQQESNGWIQAFDVAGNLQWSQNIPGGLRGSVAISQGDYVVAGGLNGNLYFLNKADGAIVNEINFARTERGLWTTPSFDAQGDIYLTVKETRHKGALYRLDSSGNTRWKYSCGKALSVPVIDAQARVYFGSWTGHFLCLQT